MKPEPHTIATTPHGPVAGGPALAPTDRQAFVRAFVEHSRVRPTAATPARPHLLVFVAMLTVVAMLAAGLVANLIHPTARTSAGADASAPFAGSGLAAPATAISGWGCPNGQDFGSTAGGGGAGWHAVSSGGWAGNGCNGAFATMPPSGSAASADPSQYALWYFTTGPVSSCRIHIYLPRMPAGEQATTAAQYLVLSGQQGYQYASFTINQAERPGSWVVTGAVPIQGTQVAVKLTDLGVSAGGVIAMTQVSLTCAPAVSS